MISKLAPQQIHKMDEKLNFMVLELYFYLNYISNKDDCLPGGYSSWSVIRKKKTEHFKIIKKSIMAVQKYKNI